jgi:hypothetical protein
MAADALLSSMAGARAPLLTMAPSSLALAPCRRAADTLFLPPWSPQQSSKELCSSSSMDVTLSPMHGVTPCSSNQCLHLPPDLLPLCDPHGRLALHSVPSPLFSPCAQKLFGPTSARSTSMAPSSSPPVHGCQPLLPFCPTAQQLCAPPPMDAQKFLAAAPLSLTAPRSELRLALCCSCAVRPRQATRYSSCALVRSQRRPDLRSDAGPKAAAPTSPCDSLLCAAQRTVRRDARRVFAVFFSQPQTSTSFTPVRPRRSLFDSALTLFSYD